MIPNHAMKKLVFIYHDFAGQKSFKIWGISACPSTAAKWTVHNMLVVCRTQTNLYLFIWSFLKAKDRSKSKEH